jgi:hypothetical protein
MTSIIIPEKCRACDVPRRKHTPKQRAVCSRRTQVLTANKSREIEKPVVTPDKKIDRQSNRRFLKSGFE